MTSHPLPTVLPSAAAYPGYFADPFVLRLENGSYVAYGTNPPAKKSASVFEALTSSDLVHWTSAGSVLRRLPEHFGDQYWAPEVAFANGSYWMYYSVGRGIEGHHIRVARSEGPTGPFRDLEFDLTPTESFAIDAHPYLDIDGQWYLFYARDVIHHERPGTHIAVAPLSEKMTKLAGPSRSALTPNADWQIYERDRAMYGSRFDWHTLEGPAVVQREGRYWMTYSGGAWTGPGYAVAVASAEHPLGPWRHVEQRPLLATTEQLVGPGHNSLTTAPDGTDVIAFHAWDSQLDRRRLHLRHLHIEGGFVTAQ